jgi:hypothetical protein
MRVADLAIGWVGFLGCQTWRAGVDWLGWISWTTMMVLMRRKKNSGFFPGGLVVEALRGQGLVWVKFLEKRGLRVRERKKKEIIK